MTKPKKNKMINTIDETNIEQVTNFCRVVKTFYTIILPPQEMIDELIRIVNATTNPECAMVVWINIGYNKALFFTIYPFICKKMVNVCLGYYSSKENVKKTPSPTKSYPIRKDIKIIDESMIDTVINTNICSKCNQEIKERILFFGSFVGCMC